MDEEYSQIGGIRERNNSDIERNWTSERHSRPIEYIGND